MNALVTFSVFHVTMGDNLTKFLPPNTIKDVDEKFGLTLKEPTLKTNSQKSLPMKKPGITRHFVKASE